MPPLAKLIPIKDTINFKDKVVAHQKTNSDLQGCLKSSNLKSIRLNQNSKRSLKLENSTSAGISNINRNSSKQ
jgi:hypothetical protein